MLFQKRNKTRSISGEILFISLAWLLLSLSGCAEYKFKNQTWWGSLQEDGAAQFDTLSPRSAVLDMKQFLALWNDPAQAMICTNATTEQDLYTGLRQLCSVHPGECSVELVQRMKAFNAKARRPRQLFLEGLDLSAEPANSADPASMEELGLRPAE